MKTIQSEDLNKGMLCTVLQTPGAVAESGYGRTIKTKDKLFTGRILKILAVDLPFVVVRAIPENGGVKGFKWPAYTLDVRETRFGSITQEYAQAVTGKKLSKYFRNEIPNWIQL